MRRAQGRGRACPELRMGPLNGPVSRADGDPAQGCALAFLRSRVPTQRSPAPAILASQASRLVAPSCASAPATSEASSSTEPKYGA